MQRVRRVLGAAGGHAEAAEGRGREGDGGSREHSDGGSCEHSDGGGGAEHGCLIGDGKLESRHITAGPQARLGRSCRGNVEPWAVLGGSGAERCRARTANATRSCGRRSSAPTRGGRGRRRARARAPHVGRAEMRRIKVKLWLVKTREGVTMLGLLGVHS